VNDRFDIVETALTGLYQIQRKPRGDDRGWLERMYCSTDLAEVLGSRAIVQVNRSLTRAKGTVRGMHYQISPSGEAKLVSCLRGEIFDVAVDLRRHSSTFLQWHGEMLSAENRRSLFVPEGFAHGFQAIEDDCEVLYLSTAAYDPSAERGVHPLDPQVAIAWPREIENLSERDAAHAALAPGFDGVVA